MKNNSITLKPNLTPARILIHLILILLILPLHSLASTASYIYDDLGRLSRVIDDQGNVATYNYDEVGNLLSIIRSDASLTGISITAFSPQKGSVGTEVTIFGSGFSNIPAENQVTFNGTQASVLSAEATKIVTQVPTGASSGPISVTSQKGSATSSEVFTVTLTISISIDPARATVVSGTSRQFTATVTGLADQSVVWSMEGNGTLAGTLSDTGLYSVPSSFANTAKVTIRATSLADITKSATATVDVLPSGTLGPYVTPQVSVAIDQTQSSTGPFVAPQVSVGIDQSQIQSGPFVAPQVSVGIDQSATQSGPFAAPQVSVTVDQTATQSGPFVAPEVSVSIDQTSSPSGPFEAPQVSVALIPIITSISPNSGAQGAIDLPITSTGKGLAGASSISLLLNGAVDSTITVSNITANAEGTQVTALFTISGTAPAGLRVVRITTANGISPAAMMEGNTFMVTIP